MGMKPLSLRKIEEVTGGTYIGAPEEKDLLITGVVRDNHDVKKGSLFVCFQGEHVDGHDFAPEAFSSGAYACLTEKNLSENGGAYILVDSTFEALKKLAEYYRSLFSIPIIGITGSVGKTTTKEMIASVLSQKYKTLKTKGNLNNEIGVPLTLLSLEEEHEAAVIEMGISDFGEMKRLSKMVRPNICVMTVIGHSHLENLGNLEGVLRAKSEIFEYMPPDSTVMVNGDDELLYAMEIKMPKICYGFSKRNDIYSENIKNLGTNGVAFDLVRKEKKLSASVHSFGKHLVSAALSAAAVASFLSIDDEKLLQGFLDYAPVGGRANVFSTDYITIIDDAYNANPDSMKAGIQSLCELKGRRVAILGDMKELGEKEIELHKNLGILAGQSGLDVLICCGALAEHIYQGGRTDGRMQVWYFSEKAELFSVLPAMIQKNDTILVKASHSMAFEEIVNELKTLV